MSFHESKIVTKTRKQHECAMCHNTILTGMSCHNEVGNLSGDFYSYYLCNRCYDLIMCDSETWIDDGMLTDCFESALVDSGLLQCDCDRYCSIDEYDFIDDLHMTVRFDCGKTHIFTCDVAHLYNKTLDNT